MTVGDAGCIADDSNNTSELAPHARLVGVQALAMIQAW